MKRIYAIVILILVIVILAILAIWYFRSRDKAVIPTPQTVISQKLVNANESKILSYPKALDVFRCPTATTKHVAVPLSSRHSADFDYVVCHSEGTPDNLNTDYKKVISKDGTVYGYLSTAPGAVPREIMKYWIFESEADVAAYIYGTIRNTSDGSYCQLSVMDHGETKEWFVSYTGPYTGNGVEPGYNCGDMFGTGAGGKVIFSQKNVLMKLELGTENMYSLDPRTVKIK